MGNAGAGFGRRSFAGLQSNFGTIALGRDYTPFFWATLATDVLGYGLYGNAGQTLAFLTPSVANQVFRASNSIFYTSPRFGGVVIRANYGAGAESPGGAGIAPRRSNTQYGLSAEYSAGPITLSAAYQEINVPGIGGNPAAFIGGTSKERDSTIGAKYNFGTFSVGAGVAQLDPVGANNTARLYWVGGTVRIGAGTLLLQVSPARADSGGFLGAQATATGPAPRATVFAVAYTYPLSRRTTAYVTAGAVNNNANAALPLNASTNLVGGGVRDADPRGFGIGLRHTF